MKCPRCEVENDAGARFCEDCGARLEATCPSCGTPVTPGKKFCRSCGAAQITEPAGGFARPESYIPKHLAEKILTSKAALEGERKQVTVLFADLKGSMELLADRDPEEARKLLDPVLEHMMEAVHRALSGAYLSDVLSQLGRFDEAIGHAEAAVRIAEAADHPFTLFYGLMYLGLAHLCRGDLPRATRVLERGLDLCRTWQFIVATPVVAATLGAAHALAGRVDEALPLVAGAVEEFRRRQIHAWPARILLCAGMTCLWAGRIDEAASHTREALALTRRLGARGSEAHALCLAGAVASTGAAEDAPGYYREALALAGALGMRPLVAHCHLGLGKLYRRTGKREQAREHLTAATTLYREMDMQFWLEQAEAEMRELG